MLALVRDRVAIGIRDGAAAAGVAFTYGHLGMGLSRPRSPSFSSCSCTSCARASRRRTAARSSPSARASAASPQMGLLSTVLQTLSMRDAMTARHWAAVARYSWRSPAIRGLVQREQDQILTAALLHDIGKRILPGQVLFANRKLTDDEWELIKLHPEQGAKLVERIEGYGPVAEIVLHHHQKYAGGGYPRASPGGHPLGARIISVADTYDVMTSRDSYRRPVSWRSRACGAPTRRGNPVDPKVVEVFERMISRSAWRSATRRGRLRVRAGLRASRHRLRASRLAAPRHVRSRNGGTRPLTRTSAS